MPSDYGIGSTQETMNRVTTHHTPLTALTSPFSFPAITSAGVATSLDPTTLFYAAHLGTPAKVGVADEDMLELAHAR